MKVVVSPQNIGFGTIISIVLVCIIPLFLMISMQLDIFPAWLCYFTLCYLIVSLIYKANDYLYASFLVFFYVFLLIAPIIQMSNGYFPWGGTYSKLELAQSWWLTFVSLLGFEFGYSVFVAKTPKLNSNKLFLLNQKGLILLLLVSFSCILFGLSFVGFSSLFVPRNELSSILTESVEGNRSVRTIVQAIMRVPPVVTLLILINDLFNRIKIKSNQRLTLIRFAIVCVFAMIVFVINNPISTARFWVGAIFLSILLMYVLEFTKKKAFSWFIFNVLILISLFPVMDIYRKGLDGGVVQAIINSDPARELENSPDFDAFQQQTNSIITEQRRGLSLGKQTISSVLFFVPRKIWPNKSRPSGSLIAETVGYSFKNLSAPIAVEFYLDGWYIAVFWGMFILGIIYRKVFVKFLLGQNMLWKVFFCFFCSYQVYFLRGSLMTVIASLTVTIVCLFSLNYFKNLFFIKLNIGKN